MVKARWGAHHPRPVYFFVPALVALFLSTLSSAALARNAYVANPGSESVSVIDTGTNQVVGPPIMVGHEPNPIAITPDGRFAYVVNVGSGSVSVIDTGTNQVVGPPIMVGLAPYWIAITPDGRFAYVVNFFSGNVSVIDTGTNEVVGSPIAVGTEPLGIAITPDGRFAYVNAGSVSVIDIQANQPAGAPITVGAGPYGIAITPNGGFAYVTNQISGNVSVIDTGTNEVVGSPIAVGNFSRGIAITPDGSRAYAVNSGASGTVSVIDTGTNQVVGPPIAIGTNPERVAITPDGRFAYVTWEGGVSVVDTGTNEVVGSPIAIGGSADGVAITPNQPPRASFTTPAARPGVPVAFNSAASSDTDGSIGRYDWDFGDGGTAPDGGPTPRHSYRKPGSYKVTLTLTDNEGCSTALIFTGQTASCNGQPSASEAQTLKVAYPGVRVKCPRRARRRGCRFKLRAVTRRRKGKAETRLAGAKLKAGESKIVSLKPKKKFAAKLAAAKKVLVREKVAIKGSKRTVYRRLKVVR